MRARVRGLINGEGTGWGGWGGGWKPRENYAVCLIYIPVHLELMYRRYYNDASKATTEGAHPPPRFPPKNWRRWCTSSRIKSYRLYWRPIDACSLSFFLFFFHTRSCKFEAEKSRDRHRLIKHRWGTIDFPAARLLLTLIVARLRFAFNATLPRLVGISSLMKERIRMNGWNKSCGGVKDVERFWEVWKDEFWILKLLLLFQIICSIFI